MNNNTQQNQTKPTTPNHTQPHPTNPTNHNQNQPKPNQPPPDKQTQEILKLKKQHNAIILAHNYQIPEIQDLADYVGDSLGLSQQAAQTKADTIVFCGVHFMAETAKILNPHKTVLLPDKNAGCSLEQSCPAHQLQTLQQTNPNYYTIAYINCSAQVKALSDIICTSGNAKQIVQAAPKNRDLLFVPDENLGAWIIEQTNRPMTLWKGNCYAHLEITQQSILNIRKKHPNAPLIAHPECTKSVRLLADEICSTEKMIHYAHKTKAQTLIIATESGILHRLKKECPQKQFIPAPTDTCQCSQCRYMKMNTLPKLRNCLQNLNPQINLPPQLLQKARTPIDRMLALSA